jgi:hypothetical protein
VLGAFTLRVMFCLLGVSVMVTKFWGLAMGSF